MTEETTPDTLDRSELLALTSEIVSSHVSNNSVNQQDLSSMIETVFSTLEGLGAPKEELKEELTEKAQKLEITRENL